MSIKMATGDRATSEHQTTTGQTTRQRQKTLPQTNASDPREPQQTTQATRSSGSQTGTNRCQRTMRPATSVKPRSNARKHRRRQMQNGWARDAHRAQSQLRNMRGSRAWSSTKPLKARAQTSNHDPAGSARAAAQRKSDDQPRLSSPTELPHQPTQAQTRLLNRWWKHQSHEISSSRHGRTHLALQGDRTASGGAKSAIAGATQVVAFTRQRAAHERKNNRHNRRSTNGPREGSGQMTDECRYVTWPQSWDPATSENQTTTGQTAPKCEKTPPQTDASDPREPQQATQATRSFGRANRCRAKMDASGRSHKTHLRATRTRSRTKPSKARGQGFKLPEKGSNKLKRTRRTLRLSPNDNVDRLL